MRAGRSRSWGTEWAERSLDIQGGIAAAPKSYSDSGNGDDARRIGAVHRFDTRSATCFFIGSVEVRWEAAVVVSATCSSPGSSRGMVLRMIRLWSTAIGGRYRERAYPERADDVAEQLRLCRK